MKNHILEALISNACRINSKNLSFQWIGGESLLVGIDFYKKALELSNKYKKKKTYVDHNIQTNGTLIDKRWIDFFKKHREFSLSLSFEITRELQNRLRARNGKIQKGTYDSLTNIIQGINSAGIELGVLSVITPLTLKTDPEKWLSSAVNSGVRRVGLQLSYHHSYWGKLTQVAQYLEWIHRLFLAQARYNENVEDPLDFFTIRESYYIYNLIRNPNRKSSSCHNVNRPCTDYLFTVDVDGEIFSHCDAFMGLMDKNFDFRMGNVLTDDFNAIFSSEKYMKVRRAFWEEKSSCNSCLFHILCQGGCPIFKTRIPKRGQLLPIKDSKSYCQLQKGLLSYARDLKKRNLIRKAYRFLENKNSLPVNFIKN
jgi:uncharacterized protein